MCQKLISCVFSLFLFLLSAVAMAESLTLFPNERSAQKHCPRDTIVWLNLPSGVWHYKGQRWYGRTKHGAYVCEQDAGSTGYRRTLNGQ